MKGDKEAKREMAKVRKEMNETTKTLGGLVLVGAVAGMLPKGK